MKRLLLLLPLLLAAPVSAQVDPAVHKMCRKTASYSMCLQIQKSLGSKSNEAQNQSGGENSERLTSWQQHLNENPDLKEWVQSNPSLAEKTKLEWLRANNKGTKKIYSINEDEEERCFQKGYGYTWDGRKCRFSRRSLRNDPNSVKRACPPGKSLRQKTTFLGLVKLGKVCLSDYEVEALRQGERHRTLQNFSETLKRINPPVVNCYSNTYGNYTSTTCY